MAELAKRVTFPSATKHALQNLLAEPAARVVVDFLSVGYGRAGARRL